MKVVFATLFLALATGAFAQTDITALLSDPKYQPFIQVVLTKATVCIMDPAITSGKFSLDSCPGLNSLLDQIDNDVANPTIACEASCSESFALLDPACFSALKTAFDSSTDEFGKLATEFFAACDASSGAAPTPTSPTTSPAATTSPSTISPMASPSPSPSPSPSEPVKPENWATALVPQGLVLVLVNAVLFLAL